MTDVLWAAQEELVYDTLSADVTLVGDSTTVGLAPGGVHDQPPANPAGDYVLIGEFTEVPLSVHGARKREVTLTLHVYSFALTNENAMAIKERIETLIGHVGAWTLTGWRATEAYQDFAESFRERDPTDNRTIRRVVVRYRIILKAT